MACLVAQRTRADGAGSRTSQARARAPRGQRDRAPPLALARAVCELVVGAVDEHERVALAARLYHASIATRIAAPKTAATTRRARSSAFAPRLFASSVGNVFDAVLLCERSDAHLGRSVRQPCSQKRFARRLN